MRAHLAEFVGTFGLVFFGVGAIANGLAPMAVALAFGLVIALMIYNFGHISGAHFNPAVSTGFAVGRHFPWARVASYAAAQFAGAICAALLLRLMLRASADPGIARPAGSDLQAFAREALLTFFLMLVITAVATDIRAVGRAAALAIGGMVGLDALVGGSISGASIIQRAPSGRRSCGQPDPPVDLPGRAHRRIGRGSPPVSQAPTTLIRASGSAGRGACRWLDWVCA